MAGEEATEDTGRRRRDRNNKDNLKGNVKKGGEKKREDAVLKYQVEVEAGERDRMER